MQDSKEKSHYVVSRKIDEGIEIVSHDVRIILRRIQGKRAYFYICAPRNTRIERIKDNRAVGVEVMDDDHSQNKHEAKTTK